MNISRAYRVLATSNFSLKTASFDASNGSVIVTSSVPDFKENKQRKFSQTFRPEKDGFQPGSFPSELRDVIASVPSPSGRFVAVLRKVVSPDQPAAKTPDHAIDILSRSRLLFTTPVSSKVHGAIHGSVPFAGFDWNVAEDRFVYVAELPLEKPVNLWADAEQPSDKDKDSAGKKAPALNHFDYVEDWGEQMTGTVKPGIFVLSLVTRLVTPLSIQISDKSPEWKEFSVGQPRFCPNDSGVVFTAWPHGHPHRRLGLIYYNTRRSSLFFAPLVASSNDPASPNAVSGPDAPPSITCAAAQMISGDDYSANSARFSPNGKQLVYTTTTTTFLHKSGSMLRAMPWPATSEADGARRTVVPLVRRAASTFAFPGLWEDELAERVWLTDSRHVLVASQWRSVMRLLVIDTSVSSNATFDNIRLVQPPAQIARLFTNPSARLLDIQGNSVLIALTDPGAPQCLFHVTISPEQTASEASSEPESPGLRTAASEWQLVFDPSGVLEARAAALDGPSAEQKVDAAAAAAPATTLSQLVSGEKQLSLPEFVPAVRAGLPLIRSELVQVPVPVPGSGALQPDVECILVRPPPGWETGKVIIFPHGGPHSAFDTSYDGFSAFLALMGFHVMKVNFRGSTGFGMDLLEILPGNCGAMDVEDCVASARRACELGLARKIPGVAADGDGVVGGGFDLAVLGGSHSGFLVCHLIGQYPKMFRAAVARNPVTNLAFQVSIGDIPDWCYVEAGLEFKHDYVVTAEEMERWFAMSPVAHISKIVTPTLIAIGANDRRVAPQQGMDFHRTLRSRGVPTRLLHFPGAQHGLQDTVHVAADNQTNAAAWFLQYMQ